MNQLPHAEPDETGAPLRRTVYLLLIAISAGSMLGRILAVNAVDNIRLEQHLQRQGRDDWRKTRPFLSSNDRSRWCTVRALVEQGTYAIDDIVGQPNWDTIDMVKHDGSGRASPAAGTGHLYSSKPPLLPTLIAGEYWLIHKLTGYTLGSHPYTVGRLMLVTINVIPMIVYFLLLARYVERYGRTDWGRIFVIACATMGTLLSAFAVVINNHLVSAVSTMICLDAVLRIWYEGRRELRWFFLAGVFAAFTAANELPALAFLAAVAAGLVWKAPREALLGFAPGALLVIGAFFGTNYAAHGTWSPPYVHKGDNAYFDDWYSFQFERDGRVRDSYWTHPDAKSPIDQGEPSRGLYAFHALAGHHGIFSLTPVWLLSLVGLGWMCTRRQPDLRALGAMIAAVSAVCLVFYLVVVGERNYGGMTTGFRWAFWFAPMWLMAMLPAADAAASRRWCQVAAAVLLCLSVLSVSYPVWNPWQHPWILDYLLHLEWVGLGPR